MADLSDGVNWFEIDNSNNKPSPNGWPEGMMPSGVNDSARADKGALKRFWNKINPVHGVTPGGGVWTFTTDNPAYPASYISGEIYCFYANGDSVGGDQFQVNGLGLKPILKHLNGAFVAIATNDISGGYAPQLVYNAGLAGGAGGFLLLNPHVPVANDGAGGILAEAITVNGPIASHGVTAGLFFADRHNAAVEWLWYADGGSAHLNSSAGDLVTVTAAGNVGTLGSVSAGASLYSAAQLYLAGQYIFFNNNPTNAQGPYIFADNSSFVWRLGSGNNSWIFQNNANSNVAYIDAVGDLNISATLTAALDVHARDLFANRNIWASAGSVTAIYIHSTGAIDADGAITGLDLVATRNIWASSGAVTAGQLTSTGNIQASNTVTGLNVTATSTVTGGYVHSTGNVQADGSFTGPSVSVGSVTASGNLSGAQVLATGDIHGARLISTGDIIGIQLRGGPGDAGTLLGWPNPDPTRHTINFGWDGVASTFYLITDSNYTRQIPWSDTIKMIRLGTDGAAPSGWHLVVASGGTDYVLYVDYTSSDARLKRGIGDSEVDALAALCAVPIRRFEWIDEIQKTFGVPQGPVAIGLVAQDMLPHMPDCVGISEGREKPYPADTHTIMHDRIDAYVIRAIQQLEARIAQLEGK